MTARTAATTAAVSVRSGSTACAPAPVSSSTVNEPVATGMYSESDLAAEGAHVVLPDLSVTADVVAAVRQCAAHPS